MEVLQDNLLEWSLLAGLLLFLGYGAFAIKKEDETAFENSKTYPLGPFAIETPNWWTAVVQEENQLHFERTDTKYEWQAKLTWLDKKIKDRDQLEEYVANFLENEKIYLDEHQSDITDFKHRIQSKTTREQVQLAYRFEGTASKDIERRIYLDLAFLVLETGVFCAYGLSSVLNGSVEGPFFEKVLYKVKLTD